MAGALRVNPGIAEISAYQGGKGGDDFAGPVYKLSSNESPLGASPDARAAYAALADHLETYPDGSAEELRDAIATRYGLNPANIVCGAGSDEILALLGKAYLAPGTEALYSAHGFLMYKIIANSCGASPVTAPEVDLTTDVDAMLAAVTPKTRVVFLANPNNPTGTYIPVGELKRLHAGLPSDVLLVIDAAYAEYVRANDYEAGIELVSSYENVVMTRTFSKIYGLAGLRVGWAYCPAAVAGVLNRVRGPFNVTAPALAAAAAAMRDGDFLDKARDHNETWRPWLEAALRDLGFEVSPSFGNFVLARFAESGGGRANAAEMYLAKRGIFVRNMTGYGLPHALRITVGSEAANHAVVAGLAGFVQETP
ncbi:Biosynthetic Aromatic amino acid aminotransferase beta @ Histidinol-phosphate aminotransferase [hydrothermal vent metagenome]|uniref:Biosynthetic Aromatic amino acid aminotransferase beta @ Histidinol-phosphate aminotransferase n=1 Tax=hydrothermal vent metagenome TaxID=652676 RepID=A0A3B0TFX7_9ZZZZ